MLFDVNDAEFDQKVINSELPVLVDCWAPSCKPCVGMHPILEALAAEYNQHLAVAKINVDENTEIARTYGIRSLPTLMLVDKGAVLGKKLGVMSGAQIADWIRSLIGADALDGRH